MVQVYDVRVTSMNACHLHASTEVPVWNTLMGGQAMTVCALPLMLVPTVLSTHEAVTMLPA